jgi:hypothetical protein
MTDPHRLIDEGADEFERELLRAGRRDQMSTRSRAAILASLGVAAPLPFAVNDPLQTAAASSSAAGKALLAKIAAGTLGALGLATGVYLAQSPTAPVIAPTGIEPAAGLTIPAAPSAELAPAVALPSAPDTSARDTGADQDTKLEARVAPKQGTDRAVRPADSITKELSQIEAARGALRAGDPARSLRLLSEYSQQHPKGSLRTEATVLRIEALSAAGDHAAASRLGKQFLAQSPNGPYARRIRSLLAQAGAPKP